MDVKQTEVFSGSDEDTQPDHDLAAAGVMLANQLSKINVLLEKRGIECQVLTYSNGKITAEYTRITKEKIA